jgi:hypothetical protein
MIDFCLNLIGQSMVALILLSYYSGIPLQYIFRIYFA